MKKKRSLKRILRGISRRFVHLLSLGVLRLAQKPDSQISVIASSPRSGGTLLSEVMGNLENALVLFEPFHSNRIPASRKYGFSWNTWKQPDERWADGQAYIRKLLSGKIRENRLAHEMNAGRILSHSSLILKTIYGNSLLPWLSTNYDFNLIYLLRHPCAVVASQIAMGAFKVDIREEIPQYIRSPELLSFLKNAAYGSIEIFAARWALEQIVPLSALVHGKWPIIDYESFVTKPVSTLGAYYSARNTVVEIESIELKPSSVIHGNEISGVGGWRNSLTPTEQSTVIRVVRMFGITLYNLESDLPDYVQTGATISGIMEAAQSPYVNSLYCQDRKP